MIETLPLGLSAFAGMIFLVWFLPGFVCRLRGPRDRGFRYGGCPEDFPPQRTRRPAGAA